MKAPILNSIGAFLHMDVLIPEDHGWSWRGFVHGLLGAESYPRRPWMVLEGICVWNFCHKELFPAYRDGLGGDLCLEDNPSVIPTIYTVIPAMLLAGIHSVIPVFF